MPILLKFSKDEIKGEVHSGDLKDCIPLDRIAFAFARPVTPTADFQTDIKKTPPQADVIHCKRKHDHIGLDLSNAAMGKLDAKYPNIEVKIYCLKGTGAKPVPYLIITLTGAKVRNYDRYGGGAGEDRAEFSLNWDTITIEYKLEATAHGGKVQPARVFFDRNKVTTDIKAK
jgi:hypothetical protein